MSPNITISNYDSAGADLGGGCRDDLRFSNTTGILQKKKTMWFIGVEVEQETSAPPPKKNTGSAPAVVKIVKEHGSRVNEIRSLPC